MDKQKLMDITQRSFTSSAGTRLLIHAPKLFYKNIFYYTIYAVRLYKSVNTDIILLNLYQNILCNYNIIMRTYYVYNYGYTSAKLRRTLVASVY